MLGLDEGFALLVMSMHFSFRAFSIQPSAISEFSFVVCWKLTADS
jgi:hypothetical protein